MSAERTAVELADDAFATPDPGYGARLALIRAAAAADGVSLAVDLHGSLVDLRFDRWALNRSPGELAAVVKRLAAEAAADALRQGREVLGELLPESSPAERVWGPETHPVRLARLDREDDAFAPATWAT
ncbi:MULTISPECIES: hypothetical protein [unclassified Amycolatopsis]|uniref:hypothetical protein n=1 Tax=unclassified Amycolatopsis TaxID=2618356 RepID=UPI002E165BF5|nr:MULTISPECIES: hypothetical protein [unclassified Amycolatopsis]WSK75778.1 hypothetical protein OG570_30945 [Amycolatopsis sp. NBC_01286]